MPKIINRTEERVHIDTIEPHPANPNDGDVAAIAESIRQNGFYGRIVVRDSTGKILAGEHRWRAAQEVGLTEVPIEQVECDDETAMRILLADNRTAEKAERQDEPLADLLESLETTQEGLTGTGYDGSDLDDLLDELGRNGHEDVDDPGAETSRAEELQEEWGTERGQLWQIGRHRLLCGDATEEGDVERLLDGAEPRLMVTDPPYGVEYDADWRSSLDEIERATGEVQNDDSDDWTEAWQLSTANVVYCWHADRHASVVQVSLEQSGFGIRSQIVWMKPHYALSRGHYHWQHEPCWYGICEGEVADWIGGRDQSTVWEIDNGTFQGSQKDNEVDTEVSTQKPVEAHARPIRNHEGDVYEPFCGSGTGIIAAEQEGRTCYAMEIDPAYCAVILERCSEAGMECEQIS
jgi:DNA modification methylase